MLLSKKALSLFFMLFIIKEICQHISFCHYTIFRKCGHFAHDIQTCTDFKLLLFWRAHKQASRPRSAVGNVSGYRWVSDCRSSSRVLDLGTLPYFYGD